MQIEKNIWMITKWYPHREDPQLGVFIQKHARAISQNNKISVLYLHATEKLSQAFETEEVIESNLQEVIIYYKKDSSVLRRLINGSRYYFAYRKGIKILKKNNPDPHIIHAYILLRPGLLSAVDSWFKKIPYVISEQWSGYLTGRFLRLPFWKKAFTRLIFKRAAAVSSVSTFLYKRMKECGLENDNIHIIPNIIDIPEKPVYKKESFIKVLVVADLVDEIKNISGLIKVISQIGDAIPFQLQIIGHGPDEEKLKKIAGENNLLDRIIFFKGLKSNKEVYEYLQECDFLVMNSRYETFSLICAEAMSCGKPVLATRCGGPNEYVNSETGILIEPGNEEELKRQFLFMLQNFHQFDPQLIQQYVKGLFSLEKVASDFRIFYNSALSREGKKD